MDTERKTMFIPRDPATFDAVRIIETIFFTGYVYGKITEEGLKKLVHALEYLGNTGDAHGVEVFEGLVQ